MVINGTSDPIINAPAAGTKKRFSISIGTLFWILVISIQLWLVVGDVTLFGPEPASLDDKSAVVVGELAVVSSDVRLKNDKDVLWSEPQGGEPLIDGQSLMTLEGASAEVAFKDGSGLVVGENSLVQIRSQEKVGIGTDVPLLVSLVRGSIHKRKSRGPEAVPMEIQLGRTQVRFSPESELTLTAAGEGEGYTMQVGAGEVEITTHEGVVKAQPGDRVLLSQDDGDARIEKLTLRAEQPRDQATLDFESERREVEFTWSDDETSANSRYFVDIAKDENFMQGRVTLKSTGAGASSVFKLKGDAGEWFWRVRSSDGRSSGIRRLRLHIPDIPIPAYPRAGEVLERVPEGVGFSWDLDGEPEYFELRIETPEGREIRTIRSESRNARVESLALGSYRWLVRALNSDGHATPWSEWRDFRLQEQVSDKLPAPKPIGVPKFIRPDKPRGGQGSADLLRRAVASLMSMLIPSAAAAERKNSWDVVLKWSEVEGADQYRVQISRTRGFGEIIAESTTRDTSWNWNYRIGMENTKGRVFYRVAAIGSDGVLGEFSQAIPVEVPDEILEKRRIETARPEKIPPPAKVVRREEPLPAEPSADWTFSAGLRMAFSGFSQTSETSDLTGVSSASWFPHQALRLEVARTREGSGYSAVIDLQTASFEGSSVQDLDQPTESGIDAGLWVFRRSGPSSRGGARWSVGAMTRYSYRWERASDEAVESLSALSGGPALALDYVFPWAGEERLFAPDRLEARLGLPVVGFLLDTSFWGAQVQAQIGWDAFKLSGVPFEISLEGFFDFQGWSSPASTQLSRYGFSVGLTAALAE